MRIPSHVYVSQQQVARSEQADGQSPTKAAKAAAAGPGDVTVRVSPQAIQLAEDSAVDMDKVNRLRAAIDSGTFRIDAESLAARIVDQE